MKVVLQKKRKVVIGNNCCFILLRQCTYKKGCKSSSNVRRMKRGGNNIKGNDGT